MTENFHKDFRRPDTSDATAVAADIAQGKIAYAGGSKITGTKASTSGLQLLLVNPTGIAGSTYNAPSNKDAQIVANPSLTLSGSSNWDIDADGYAYDSTSYSTLLQASGAPAYSGRRKYDLWGKTKNAALSNNKGVRIIINKVNFTTDYWTAALVWNNTAGTYQIALNERTGGVDNNRGAASFSTALDVPATFHLSVMEQGDAVVVSCSMYEIDAIADDEAISLSYSVGSRPNKATTTFDCGLTNDPGDEWLIRGFMVSDLA